MKYLKYVLVAVALFACCAVNAQWTSEYTGENLNDIFNANDFQTTALAHNTMLEQDPAWTADDDLNTLNTITLPGGAVLPGGGPGTGVAETPVGDAMWIVFLLMGVLIGIRKYRCLKTK